MRLPLFFCLIIACSSASSQKQECVPNINLKAIVCKGISKDSITLRCIKGSYGLMASDSNFIITSFNVTAGEIDNEIWVIPNVGTNFTGPVMNMLYRLKPGSFIEFSCINAKVKDSSNNFTYVLRSLSFDLK